jgi:hypothetical protein
MFFAADDDVGCDNYDLNNNLFFVEHYAQILRG